MVEWYTLHRYLLRHLKVSRSFTYTHVLQLNFHLEFSPSDAPTLPPLSESGVLRSLKMSIDRGMRFYKSSTMGQSRPTLNSHDDAETRAEVSVRQSWEDDEIIRQGAS